MEPTFYGQGKFYVIIIVSISINMTSSNNYGRLDENKDSYLLNDLTVVSSVYDILFTYFL